MPFGVVQHTRRETRRDGEFDRHPPMLVFLVCSHWLKLFFKTPLSVSHLAAELPRATRHHDPDVNFETVVAVVLHCVPGSMLCQIQD